MAYLWIGGEDSDFPNGVTGFTIGGTPRTGWARTTIQAASLNAIARSTPFAARGAGTTTWLSCRHRLSNGSAAMMHVGLCRAAAANGAGIYVAHSSAGGNKVGLYKTDGTTHTQLVAEAGASFAVGTMKKIDVQFQNFGAAMVIRVYVDGVLVITYDGGVSGDPRPAALTELSQVGLSNGAEISEIVVADQDTRGIVGVVTGAPNAAGDQNQWAGAYTEIDETTLSDADVMVAASAGLRAQVNLSNLPAGASGYAIPAVRVAARASDSAATALLKLGVKSNGTISVPAGVALTVAPQVVETLYGSINPATGAPWTPADFDALQIAFESA